MTLIKCLVKVMEKEMVANGIHGHTFCRPQLALESPENPFYEWDNFSQVLVMTKLDNMYLDLLAIIQDDE